MTPWSPKTLKFLPRPNDKKTRQYEYFISPKYQVNIHCPDLLEQGRRTGNPGRRKPGCGRFLFDPSVNLAPGVQILPYVEETEGTNIIMIGWEMGMDFRIIPFDSARALSFDYQLSFNYMSNISGIISASQALGLRHALGMTLRTSGVSLGFYVTYEDAFTLLQRNEHYSYLGASASLELETGDYRPYFEYTWLENLEGGWSSRIYQMVLGLKSFIF